jgi:hypothetical protein
MSDTPTDSVLPSSSVIFIFDGTEPAVTNIYDLLDSGIPIDEDGSDKRFIGALCNGRFVDVDLIFIEDGKETSCSIWHIIENGVPIDGEGDELDFVRLEVAES